MAGITVELEEYNYDVSVKDFFDAMDDVEKKEMLEKLTGTGYSVPEMRTALDAVYEQCLGIGRRCDHFIKIFEELKSGRMPA